MLRTSGTLIAKRPHLIIQHFQATGYPLHIDQDQYFVGRRYMLSFLHQIILSMILNDNSMFESNILETGWCPALNNTLSYGEVIYLNDSGNHD